MKTQYELYWKEHRNISDGQQNFYSMLNCESNPLRKSDLIKLIARLPERWSQYQKFVDRADNWTEQGIYILNKVNLNAVWDSASFDGVKYPVRVMKILEIEPNGDSILKQYNIATDSLFNEIWDEEEGETVDAFAESIDQKMFFYAEDEIIFLSNEELLKNIVDSTGIEFKMAV